MEIEERDFIDLIQCFVRVVKNHQLPETNNWKIVRYIAKKYGREVSI